MGQPKIGSFKIKFLFKPKTSYQNNGHEQFEKITADNRFIQN